jgi:hypothetical protein
VRLQSALRETAARRVDEEVEEDLELEEGVEPEVIGEEEAEE